MNKEKAAKKFINKVVRMSKKGLLHPNDEMALQSQLVNLLKAAEQPVQSDGALPSYNCECGFIVAVGETECMRCHTPRR